MTAWQRPKAGGNTKVKIWGTTMNIKIILPCVLVVLCTQSNLAWGGLIYKTVQIVPSDLKAPGSTQAASQLFSSIACTDAYTGLLVNCGYSYSIVGLAQPSSEVANNGGHTHGGIRDLGKVRTISPNPGEQGSSVKGSTNNEIVMLSHDMPEVSGKIETAVNITVPPGWYTVYPESCDGSRTSWCYDTTIDVGVSDLIPLPDGSTLYKKVQGATSKHTGNTAYYGTASAISNLTAIARWYDKLSFGNIFLSINDMSLIRGGLLDIHGDYTAPHAWHRIGESADINKDYHGDCTKNKLLLVSTYMVMGGGGGKTFTSRTLPSFGHFLCETGNAFNYSNNIHIDLR